jgi:hypothetical protein
MESYFSAYPNEKGFYVFEDGNVFFLKDRNLAEKHKQDTKQNYELIERPVVEEKSETKTTTKKTK